MTYPGDRSLKNLRALHAEMRATLQRINGEPLMMVDSTERSGNILKKQILELINQIYNGTEDKHQRCGYHRRVKRVEQR